MKKRVLALVIAGLLSLGMVTPALAEEYSEAETVEAVSTEAEDEITETAEESSAEESANEETVIEETAAEELIEETAAEELIEETELLAETVDSLPVENDEDVVFDEATGYAVLEESAEVEAETYAATAVPTEAQAYSKMIALKSSYPEGMSWTNDNYYEWNGGIYSGGYGCAGFAFRLSDAAFGDLPARIVNPVSMEMVHVGDILRINNNNHSVIVLEVYPTYLVLAEGNYNSSIHWGRTYSSSLVSSATYLMTRYPVGTFSDYLIKYDANGGSGAPDTQEKYKGVSVSLSSAVPVKFGYTFKGWATSKTATTAAYKAGATYTTDANVTLYAVWEKCPSITGALPKTISVEVYGSEEVYTAGAYYTFTPSKTGNYSFKSTGKNQEGIQIWENNMYCLYSGWGTDENLGFELQATLYAGTTYYLNVLNYGVYEPSTITFTIDTVCTGHSYTEKKTSNDYLKTAATSTTAAIYYYACSKCGRKGTTTYSAISPVSNLKAATTSSGVKLSWSESKFVTGYQIYRAASGSSSYTRIATTANTSYTDKTASGSTAYTYKVRAYYKNSSGENTYSSYKSVKGMYVASPTKLSVASGSSGVSVSWGSVKNAAKYEIYRMKKGESEYKAVKTTSKTSWEDTTAVSGQTYYYKVRAYVTSGSTSYKSAFCADEHLYYLARVSSLSSTNTASGIKLSWGSVKGATGYQVYRAVYGSSTYTRLATTTSTAYTDNTAKSSSAYTYKVRVYHKTSSGNIYSPYRTSTIKRVIQVSGVKASNTTDGIKISWQSTSSDAKYQVYRKKSGESSYTKIISSSDTNVIDTDVKSGVTYYYKVRAYRKLEDTAYMGAYSEVVKKVR